MKISDSVFVNAIDFTALDFNAIDQIFKHAEETSSYKRADACASITVRIASVAVGRHLDDRGDGCHR